MEFIIPNYTLDTKISYNTNTVDYTSNETEDDFISITKPDNDSTCIVVDIYKKCQKIHTLVLHGIVRNDELLKELRKFVRV